MKNLSKYSLIGLIVLLSACQATELDLLTDPNNPAPETAEINFVANAAQLDFVTFVDEASDETMPYVRMVAMADGSRYNNQDGPTSFDFIWRRANADIIPDLDLIITSSDENGFTATSSVARILKAYVLFTLVDMFGDIPYSQSQQGTDVISPPADDDQAVYEAAAALLDRAITDLTDPRGVLGITPLYYSTPAQWLRLANTLKLRYYLNTRLVNSGSAAGITSLVTGGNIISTIAQDFQFKYGTNRQDPDSRHPYYSDSYESGGPGLYMSNYYMWLFFGEKNTEDPRLRYYFFRQDCDETDENQFTLPCPNEPYPIHWPPGDPFCTASGVYGDPMNNYGGYWGRDQGDASGIPPDDLKRTAWGLYPAGGKFDANDCAGVSNGGTDGGKGQGIQPIILSSWVFFMRAEAALTMNTEADPAMLLETGIRQSIQKVMGFESVSAVDEMFKPTPADIDAYVAEVMANYAAADMDGKLGIIIKEYMLALHGNGLEMYNAYRRTGHPRDMQLTKDPSPGAFPRLLFYPANYVNLNSSASQRDVTLTQQVFWDTNPAGFVD